MFCEASATTWQIFPNVVRVAMQGRHSMVKEETRKNKENRRSYALRAASSRAASEKQIAGMVSQKLGLDRKKPLEAAQHRLSLQTITGLVPS